MVAQTICAATIWKPAHVLPNLQALFASGKCCHDYRHFIERIVGGIGLAIVERQQHATIAARAGFRAKPGTGFRPSRATDVFSGESSAPKPLLYR